jgi:hypothetical protein
MMSSNIFPLIALAIVAVIIVAALLVTRRVRTRLKGPFGTRFDMEASSPGIHATRMTSQEGRFRAHDSTSGGVRTDQVTAKQDIDVVLPPLPNSFVPVPPRSMNLIVKAE